MQTKKPTSSSLRRSLMARSSERAAPPPHQRGNNIDLSGTAALHALFGTSITLLLALVSLMYLGSTKNPFETNWLPMMSVISFIHFYFMGVLSEIRHICAEHGAVNTTNFYRIVYVVAGVIILWILGFILCGLYVLIFMNPGFFFLVEALLLMFKRIVPNDENPTTIASAPEESPSPIPNDLESNMGTSEMESDRESLAAA